MKIYCHTCTVLGYIKSKFLQIWKIHFSMPARKFITSNYMSFLWVSPLILKSWERKPNWLILGYIILNDHRRAEYVLCNSGRVVSQNINGDIFIKIRGDACWKGRNNSFPLLSLKFVPCPFPHVSVCVEKQ